MYVSRLVRRIAPVFRLCHPGLQRDLDRHGRGMIMATSKNEAMIEPCRRSLATSSYQYSPLIKKTLSIKDKRSRPRFAEDRKSTVEPVLAPDEAKGIVLRPSTPEDCRAIYKCLLAHAEWEGCRDLFKITEQDLIRDGFGANPIYQCDVAEAHDESGQTSIIGYGLYTFIFCAWDGRSALWENIFIHPQYRDLGIGSILLHEVTKRMYALGCRTVLGYFDENEIGLKRWYVAEGYESITKKHNFHLYMQSGKKLERYINQDGKNDEYLRKASSRGIHIKSIISKND
eukprot:XP_003725283.1 PREDICTED: diamine acetyltransferase 2 [Strongylocentrotus purpuratus]